MQLLIIGIDGGDADIIRAMDMPCLQKIIGARRQISINEDLWSRGWSEILVGNEGTETGAFYAKPQLDGTNAFTQSYSLSDYAKVPRCIPLWEQIVSRGKSLGFFNLPTTLPAPQVPGFFISGAGSGFSPASRIPETACHPREVFTKLLEENAIWEQRFGVSGITNFDFFIDRCTQAVIRRQKIFTDLCCSYRVDVGFLVQKEAVVLNNLFMKDMLPQIASGRTRGLTVRQTRISEFFRVLDDTVRLMIEKLQPQHIVVVSDHSARAYKESLNINAHLKQCGYLRMDGTQEARPRNFTNALSGSKKRLKKTLRTIKQRVSAGRGRQYTWPKFGKIDLENSLALSGRYVPGVYLNDERFGGVVADVDKAKLTEEITGSINGSSDARRAGVSARPYKSVHADAFRNDLLPDVWLDLPDNMFPEQEGDFIQENPYWAGGDEFPLLPARDITTGMKGRDALCCIEPEFCDDIAELSQHTLTVAYRMILRHLES